MKYLKEIFFCFFIFTINWKWLMDVMNSATLTFLNENKHYFECIIHEEN